MASVRTRCSTCGSSLVEAAPFCSNCGGRQDGEITVETPADHGTGTEVVVGSGRRTRRDVLVIGLVVLVVVGGLALAGRASDQSSQDTTVMTTAPTPTTAPSATSAVLDPTVAPTTTLDVVREVGPILPEPTGLQAIVVDQRNTARLVDFDTGRIEPLGYQVGGGGTFITEGRSLIATNNGTQSTIYRPNAEPIFVDADQLWPAGDGGYWGVQNGNYGNASVEDPLQVQYFGATGEAVGDPWVLPLAIVGLRPLDRSHASASTGSATYLLDLDNRTTRLLGPGYDYASYTGTASAVVQLLECDAKAACAYVTYSASGKVLRTKPVIRRDVVFGNQVLSSSPDASTFVVMNWSNSGPPQVTIQDADGLVLHEFAAPDSGLDASSLAWSPDSHWLLLFSGGSLTAWNRQLTGPLAVTSPATDGAQFILPTTVAD